MYNRQSFSIKKALTVICFALFTLGTVATVSSCTELDIVANKGLKGDKGINGIDGKDGATAFELFKQAIKDGTITEWVDADTRAKLGIDKMIKDKDNVTEAEFLYFLKGVAGLNGDVKKSTLDYFKELVATGNVDDPHNPGKKWDPSRNTQQDLYDYLAGVNGVDAPIPTIKNNRWVVTGPDGKEVDLGNAIGKNGTYAQPKIPTIGQNNNWFIDGKDTGVKAVGKTPATPTVTVNAQGFWVINGTPTNIKKEGTNAPAAPVWSIGANGNWFKDGKDTKVSAKGPKGENGSNGNNAISAYELWKQDVIKSHEDSAFPDKVMDPYNPDQLWPKENVSELDFWIFRAGRAA